MRCCNLWDVLALWFTVMMFTLIKFPLNQMPWWVRWPMHLTAWQQWWLQWLWVGQTLPTVPEGLQKETDEAKSLIPQQGMGIIFHQLVIFNLCIVLSYHYAAGNLSRQENCEKMTPISTRTKSKAVLCTYCQYSGLDSLKLEKITREDLADPFRSLAL